MYIYFLLLLYFSALSIALFSLRKEYKEKILSISFALPIFFVLALRKYTVGVDLERYIAFFDRLNSFNWGLDFAYEPGYIIFLYFLKFIGVGSQAYILIVSFFTVFSISLFIYRYSKNVFLSFFMYITFGLFSFSMSAIRQTIALSIILFSIPYIFKKKPIHFILIIAMAACFHYSALIFLPMYFVDKIKINSYYKLFTILIFIGIIIFFGDFLLSNINLFAINKYADLYTENLNQREINPLVIIIHGLINFGIILFWSLRPGNIAKLTKQEAFFFIFSLLAFLFFAFSFKVHMLSRFAIYFVPAYLIAIPNSIMNIRQLGLRVLLIFVIASLFLTYFTVSTPGGILEVDNYKFFFQ